MALVKGPIEFCMAEDGSVFVVIVRSAERDDILLTKRDSSNGFRYSLQLDIK